MENPASLDTPTGFEPIFRRSPFLDTIGPLYNKGMGEPMAIGFHVQEKHTNARGLLHGGVLATVADIAMGYALATSATPPISLITASLTVDFMGSAKIGDWVETRVEIQKLGGRLAFANVYFAATGQRIASARGVFVVAEAKRE